MKFEQVEKLINGIVENEIRHIANEQEVEFTNENQEYINQNKNTNDIYNALKNQLTEEQQYLLNDLMDSTAIEWILLNEFYFKEGLRAGLSNLKFLNELDNSYLLF